MVVVRQQKEEESYQLKFTTRASSALRMVAELLISVGSLTLSADQESYFPLNFADSLLQLWLEGTA